jgi:hypothetical protein
MSSNVGVMYLRRVMSRKGTCRTDLFKKSRPLRRLSSHVASSKLTTHELNQIKTLTAMI